MSVPTPTPTDAREPDTVVASSLPWWLRAHRALMPDYNRPAAVYWWAAMGLGAWVLAVALRELLAMPGSDRLVVLAGVGMAMLAALFPIRIPRWKNSFTAGEIFIFLLLLMHGPAAAAVAAAAEGLLGSWRTSSRWTSRLATPALAALAMYGVGWPLSAGLAALAARGEVNPGVLLSAVLAAALVYFALNALLSTGVYHLKRGIWPDPAGLAHQFGWVGITCAASASIACLLFLSFQQSGLGVLVAAAPIIGLLLATLHYYFRQQEADEAVRLGRLAAAEREAQLAATHVRELQVSEQRFHSAFSHASIGMALVSFEARVLQANAALCALLGHDDESALEGMALDQLVEEADADRVLKLVMGLKDGAGTVFSEEFRLRHRTGAELWAAVHGSRFAEVEADAPCLILQLQDVTARRQAEAGLQHLAYHDSLTGLPNRHRFQRELSDALAHAREGGGRPFGLMFLDFDRFKLINDSLGHAVGDQFLIAVSRRIQAQLRPADVVARLGGDEFAILAVDLDSQRYAVALAGRLLDALRKPFQIAGTDLSTSVSIGITFSGNGYTTTSDMLRDADTAMYKAKAAGKARYALFDDALHTEVADRMRLERDLRLALDAGEVTVEYQPVFELASGRITGFEALSRWRHPQLGEIEPATFIPVAEDAGLMVQLTDNVLRTACRR
ncbi:MAG: diguanylate cyclase, partial [Rubrivivax sp.]|nr:diguanylate cyclase [Rubrivivax sp.]